MCDVVVAEVAPYAVLRVDARHPAKTFGRSKQFFQGLSFLPYCLGAGVVIQPLGNDCLIHIAQHHLFRTKFGPLHLLFDRI